VSIDGFFAQVISMSQSLALDGELARHENDGPQPKVDLVLEQQGGIVNHKGRPGRSSIPNALLCQCANTGMGNGFEPNTTP